MEKTAINQPAFHTIEALYLDLFSDATTFPSLTDYNNLLIKQSRQILSASGKPIKAIAQRKKSDIFEYGYEPSVYLHGELQTRDNNWHDLFNLMMWLTFSRTKSVINKWQYFKLKERQYNAHRTHAENLLTQFDEGGMIVISSNKKLLQHLKSREWIELFWHNRNTLLSEMQFFIFGHAVYEQLLNSATGLTAQALIFEVDQSLMQAPLTEKISLVDDLCVSYLDNDSWHTSMRTLFSVPILGIPGWHADNKIKTYYENKQYFWQRDCITA